MKTFCVNPGLKKAALIKIDWKKKGKETYLYAFDTEILVGLVRKDKKNDYSAFRVIDSTNNQLLGANLKCDEAMNLVHDRLGLK